MNHLDLCIFKSILNNNIAGLEFCYTYNHDLFELDSQLFAKLVLGYMKAFKTIPTRRVLLEWHGDAYNNVINRFWDAVERLDYNLQEYKFDLEKLKKRYVQRTLEQIKNIPEDNNNPNETFKNIALKIQTIKTIKEGKGYVQKTVKEHVPEFRERYKAKQDNPEQSDRILCHYSGIDFATGGFAPADLFLIGGETGAGKSQLLLNIGIQIWMQNNALTMSSDEFEQGYNVSFFSLEMPYEDCYARFMARLAGVPERSLIEASLSPEELDRVRKAEEFIERYPHEFEIIDMPRDVSIDEIEVRYNEALLRYRPDAVIVDYMGLMRSKTTSNKDQDWLKMGHLGGELHEFGRVYNVVMGSAVQLTDIQRGSKEEVSKKGKGVRIGLHRVGRSSQIMHHATLGVQIETRPDETSYGDLRYYIIKNRRGPKVNKACLNKDFSRCSLLDIPYTPPDTIVSEDNEDVVENIDTIGYEGDLNENISAEVEKYKQRIKQQNV